MGVCAIVRPTDATMGSSDTHLRPLPLPSFYYYFYSAAGSFATRPGEASDTSR